MSSSSAGVDAVGACMDRPCGASWMWRSGDNWSRASVFGLLKGVFAPWPSWISARIRSHSRQGPERPQVHQDHGYDGETVSPSPQSTSQTSAGIFRFSSPLKLALHLEPALYAFSHARSSRCPFDTRLNAGLVTTSLHQDSHVQQLGGQDHPDALTITECKIHLLIPAQIPRIQGPPCSDRPRQEARRHAKSHSESAGSSTYER